MAAVREGPCYPVARHTPALNAIQRASQESALAPKPRYSSSIKDRIISTSGRYPSLSTIFERKSPPSTSSSSSVQAAPKRFLEFIKERTKTRLNRTNLPVNFFTKWAIEKTDMFGGVIPPDSKYSVPPHALPSYDGQARLRFIASCFNLPLSGTPGDLEKLLSRNLSIITCLVFNFVPSRDLLYDEQDQRNYCLNVSTRGGIKRNEEMLCAIQGLEWMDPDLIKVVDLSMTNEAAPLVSLFKGRVSRVSQKMVDMVRDEPKLGNLGSHKLHKMAVQRMRDSHRPHSLLRNAITLEDVVA